MTVERMVGEVKATRRYASSRRAEQARQTRADVLAAAGVLFLSQGFAATTVAAIARRAEVSVETVYKGFGGKPGLVRALCEQALAGEGSRPAEERSDRLQASEPDPRVIVRGFGGFVTEIAPRVAPILLLARAAAAADNEMAALCTELDATRLERMTDNARTLIAAGHLRAELTAEHAGQILWTYTSPELYDLLVLRQGWTPSELGAFVADALAATLLPASSDQD